MKYLLIIMIVGLLSSCNQTTRHKEQIKSLPHISTAEYELYMPNDDIKGILILFPGYPHNVQHITEEFPILSANRASEIAIICMNYNKHLWLEEDEKVALANKMLSILEDNHLPINNLHLGGFSSGGNVALLMAGFLAEQSQYKAIPKGIFVVDSPINLAALYTNSYDAIVNNAPHLDESRWLKQHLGNELGNPYENIAKYEKSSPYTHETRYLENIKHLKSVKIRLYTEPDSVWWKNYNNIDYDHTNGYQLKLLSENLIETGFSRVEYITTKNRGYRANGDRHPHSWSIVDENDLIEWVINSEY